MRLERGSARPSLLIALAVPAARAGSPRCRRSLLQPSEHGGGLSFSSCMLPASASVVSSITASRASATPSSAAKGSLLQEQPCKLPTPLPGPGHRLRYRTSLSSSLSQTPVFQCDNAEPKLWARTAAAELPPRRPPLLGSLRQLSLGRATRGGASMQAATRSREVTMALFMPLTAAPSSGQHPAAPIQPGRAGPGPQLSQVVRPHQLDAACCNMWIGPDFPAFPQFVACPDICSGLVQLDFVLRTEVF